MTPEQRAARAARFQAIMEDGELGEAFDAIEREYTTALLGCFDAQERDNLWRAVQVIRKVRSYFADALADGKVVAHRMQETQRLAKAR